MTQLAAHGSCRVLGQSGRAQASGDVDGGSSPSCCCSPGAQGRSRTEVCDEQGDQVDLCWSYHPEPPGHGALMVAAASERITNLVAWERDDGSEWILKETNA